MDFGESGESLLLFFPFSSLVKDASPVPLLDVTNLPTPRKFLDTSQYSTPGSSSGKYLTLQPLNCFLMGCSSWAQARVGIPFEQRCLFSLKLNAF